MKKSKKLILPVLALVVGLGSYFVTSQVVTKQQHGAVAQANTVDTQIMLRADRAVPNTVTVKVGETIQFNSADGKKHEMSIGKGGHEHDHTSNYRSGEFGPDEAWRVQIKEQGSYFFHDHYNPEINVLVVAYAPSTP